MRQCTWVVFEAMEAWRQELQRAMAQGFEDSDEEVEEEFLELVFANLDFDPDEEDDDRRMGGSTMRRRFLW